jgi:NitT/TauT family transport system substrate-binding protein
MKKPVTRFVAAIFATLWLAGPLASVAQSQGKLSAPATKVRLAIPSPSLSYLPIYVAVQRGFFARRGFEIEMIQMTPALSTAALLSRAVDYTTVPSTVATAAARGAPMKVIAFTSVKLQHMLMSRSEFKSVTDLAGKRVGASGFGNLPAYEIQILIDRYRLGSNTTIVPVASSLDRLIAMQRGTIDAAIVAAPLDIKAEEMGLKRLMHMGTILQIPQAGLTTTEEKLKKNRREVVEMLKATIEGLDYTSAQHDNVVEIIAKWIQLSHPQAAKAYDSVKDTFSRNGIPTDEQSKAYTAMLSATANLSTEPAAASIFDFTTAAEAARELASSR